ncbi:MAG TPA: hypothetical protein VFR75_06270 [Solirubrobacterales bacterium]|nr:hypothetical protein [Solirubrobacterales bacterium]
MAIAALALPAGAVAKPGYTVKPKSLHLKLQLPASNGYSASIVTNGHRQVVLSLAKGGVAATYTALGRVTRKRIEANFGSFGQVSLRFHGRRLYHPKDLLSFLYRGCKGRNSVGERGIFVGGVRFEGERDFARVRVHRAAGVAIRTYRRICKDRFRASASAIKPSEEDLFVLAQAKGDGVLRSLIGIRSPLLGFTLAVGSEKWKLGRVAILKSAVAVDYPRAIRISPRAKRPVTGKVKLAKPFEGSASYLDEGEAPPTWSGTLAIRLPGSGLVPLTGPEFEAEICRAYTEDELLRCSDQLLESQPFLYGSGSHSQPLALARLSSLR